MSFDSTQGNNQGDTNLRQADNSIFVEGVVSEKNLENTVVNGQEVIRGNIVVQTSDTNFVTFNIYSNKLTKDQKISSIYKGLGTIMESYKSIAEVGTDEATKVRVTRGQLNPNTYFDESGNEHYTVRYQSNFFNQVTGDLDPRATFDVEVFISAIKDEVYTYGPHEGETTGRVIVEGYIPLYNNAIEPISFIAPEEDGIASAIQRMYEAGMTVRFLGDIVNSRVVIQETIPVAIGKPKVVNKTSYKNELVITGASEPYDGVTTAVPYDRETIKKALNAREEILIEKKAKAMQSKVGGAPKAPAMGNRPAFGNATQGNGAKPSGKSLVW